MINNSLSTKQIIKDESRRLVPNGKLVAEMSWKQEKKLQATLLDKY
jgi:hypothetical protein